MDMATLMPFIVQAIAGAVGGNVLGAVTRGGGGFLGRTILGALGGLGAGYAAQAVPAIGDVTALWSNLMEGETGAHLANAITGLGGGAILGLLGGLLIRPRG